jgi:anti-anti-sigma factor
MSLWKRFGRARRVDFTVRARVGELTMELVGGGGTCRLALAGELDLASARLLEQALTTVRDHHVDVLELDLAGVSFIDETGLQTMLLTRSLCAAEGRAFRVLRASSQVRHALELSGAIDELRGDEPGTADGSR